MRNGVAMMLLWTAAGVGSNWAAVKAIHVEERSDVLEGKSVGPAGPYERIIARAYFAIDPRLPANRIISDIDLAPRNEDGQVEFSADLYVLKPIDPAKGNGTVIYEVSNRGGKGLMSMFSMAASSRDPRLLPDFGDRHLLEQGYTLVWLGWQFDVPEGPGLMRLYPPRARGVEGVVRAEFIPEAKTFNMPLADRNHQPYLPADPDSQAYTLTVRDRADGPRTLIARKQWRFGRAAGPIAIPDPSLVFLPAGFEPGRIYELVYQARDPALVGLGPAAVRDLISFLKYDGSGVVVLGDQRRFIKRALGFGTSQSGRFLRTFLYYGFNADEKGRKVFDGVWAHVAGAARGSFNHRFAQPSRDGHPFMNTFYPTDIFPFTDLPQTDDETGLTDALLARALKDNVVPKIFYTNGSYEYWGRSASLVHTSLDGKTDAALPESTRVYLLSGTQHGPGQFPPSRSKTQHPANPNDYRWIMRGLLAGMNQWITSGKQPPPSQYPSLAKKQLTTPADLQFPKLAGVKVPQRMQRAWRVDYGEEFRTRGIVTIEPPKVGKPFATLVPQVDSDGNEIAGVRAPEIQHPLGTYAGWNLRAAEIGAADEMYSMVGSFFPFARSKAERDRSGDPRPSIAERYQGKEDYLAKIGEAARGLAAQGFLLETDVPRLLERASMQWDHLAGAN